MKIVSEASIDIVQHRLELIGKISSRLGAGGSFTDQLSFLMAEVCHELEVDACVVREIRDNKLRIIGTHGVSGSNLPEVLPANTGLAKLLITSRKPQFVTKVDSDPITAQIHKKATSDPGHFIFSSFAGAPMISNGEVVGVFGIFAIHEQINFRTTDLDLLQIVANATAQAMMNSNLVNRIATASVSLRTKILALLDEESEQKRNNQTDFDMAEQDGEVRRQIESDLRNPDNEFLIYYQPIHRPGEANIVASEALIRWNHPRLGLIGPDVFINIAENSDMMGRIGMQVFEMVATDLSVTGRKPFQDRMEYVSVNVSINELKDKGFPEKFHRIFSSFGVTPDKIVVEITERVVLEKYSQGSRNLSALSERGYRIYVDDFGAGYTSLSHMIHFPISGIKIDRSFMPATFEDTRKVAIVRNLVSMAHDLNLVIIGEGIETRKQDEIAKELGLDLTQGFGIAEPRPLKK